MLPMVTILMPGVPAVNRVIPVNWTRSARIRPKLFRRDLDGASPVGMRVWMGADYRQGPIPLGEARAID